MLLGQAAQDRYSRYGHSRPVSAYRTFTIAAGHQSAIGVYAPGGQINSRSPAPQRVLLTLGTSTTSAAYTCKVFCTSPTRYQQFVPCSALRELLMETS
jgi:hypothetical protein